MRQVALRVAAVMTAPRHEITWARTQVQRALQGLGIPLTVSGGVFYGQCMQSMLQQLVNDTEATHALTIDYDSIFRSCDVHRLLGIIAQQSEIDAICPVQPKRGQGSVLGSCGVHKDVVWSGKPIKVRSAHFGLTVIDLEKLRLLPKPWFLQMPDERGEWGEGRTDDDVYFWRAWERAGNSVYLDPGVRLGHCEEMVSMYDDDMTLKHVYPQDWVRWAEQCDVPDAEAQQTEQPQESEELCESN